MPDSPYCPPPESEGGWRTDTCPDFVRSLGLDPGRLDDVLDAGVNAPTSTWPDPHHEHVSCIVIKDGWIVGERYSKPEAKTFRQYLSSNGKAVAATLMGILVEESDLELDSKVYDKRWLPEGFPLSDKRKDEVTLHQILKHTSGICPEDDEDGRDQWDDYAEWIVGQDAKWPVTGRMFFDPDSDSGYSSVGFGHLSLMIPHLTGKSAGKVVWERLLKPIGVAGLSFFRPPSDGSIQSLQVDDPRAADLDHIWFSAGALEMTPRDYARFAWLLMNDGTWNGDQLVPAEWLKRFRTSGDYPNIHGNCDGYFNREYGGDYPADLFRIYGSGINAAYIIPSLDLMLIRTGRGDNGAAKEVNGRMLQALFSAAL